MTLYHLAVITCPVQLCEASWGFTPEDARAYWNGRHSTHGKIVDHVVMEHTSGAAHVLEQLDDLEAKWWGLEQADLT